MKTKTITLLLAALALLAAFAAPSGLGVLAQAPAPSPGVPLGTPFTYQGHLRLDDDLVTDTCDFQLGLWDALSGGSQVGADSADGVTVSNGLFTVVLDFGAVYSGQALYLEIAVRCPSGSGTYTTLSPRQALTASPFASYSLEAGHALLADSAPWSGLSGVPAGFADGIDDDTQYSAGFGLMLTGTQFIFDYQAAISVTRPANVVVVAQANGDFATIQAAINSIEDASAGNPYLVWVAPGIYSGTVTLREYVSLAGAGQGAAIITAPGVTGGSGGTVIAANNTEIRDLTIQNTGGGALSAISVYAGSGVTNLLIHDVTAIATGGEGSSNTGFYVQDGATPTIYNSTVVVQDNTGGAYGVILFGKTHLFDTRIFVTDNPPGGTGLYLSGTTAAESRILDLYVEVNSPGYVTGIEAVGSSTNTVKIENTVVDVTGSSIAQGLYASDANVQLDEVVIRVSGGTLANYGIRAMSSGSPYAVKVNHGSVSAWTNTYLGDAEYSGYIGGTWLNGGVVNKNGGSATCAGAYDEHYSFMAAGCP